MKVILESTSKIVELEIAGQKVPARVWQGVTANGIACHAYITRIAVADNLDSSEFDRDLEVQAKPRSELEALPLRLIF